MKMIKNLNSILACGLLLMSIGLTFGQTTDERKLELIVQTGHTNYVNSVAFSPDSKTLASGSKDNTIKLWDVASGLELRTLSGHKSSVHSVAFSSDRRTLVSGSDDKTVKLWDVTSGLELRTLSGHTSSVYSVAFSPDGRTLASGSWDNTIKLWNVQTGQELKTLVGHKSLIFSVIFSPDGRTLASGSDDSTVKLWDVQTGQELKTLPHPGSVFSVTFSPNGKILASGIGNFIVKLWDLQTGQELKTLVSGNRDKIFTLKDAASGQTLKTIPSDEVYINSVAFSPDGKMLASRKSGTTIKLWDIQTGQELKTLVGHTGWVETVAFSPDGKTLASGSYDKTIKLWDVQTGIELYTLSSHKNYVTSEAFSPDGKLIACGSGDKSIKLWSVQNGQELKTLSGHTARIISVAFSPDGKTLASGSIDETIKLWDVQTGQELKTLVGHTFWVMTAIFSPDGKTLASGSFDGTIKLWNVETGQELKTLSGHTESVHSLVFSPDGKTLASASADSTVRLWDTALGLELKTLISTTDDENVKVPDAQTGQGLKIMTAHTNPVNAIAFSLDGKIIASGGGDRTVNLWDVQTGLKLKTLTGHTNSVESLAFSPEGSKLASTGQDGTVKLWGVLSGKLIKSFIRDNQETVLEFSRVVPDLFKNFRYDMMSSNGRFQIKTRENGKLNLIEVKTGKLLASLIAVDQNDWAIITPDGRFDASEGALKLMHYVYGLEIINLEQLKEMYYEPGLLQKILGYNKEPLRPIVPLKDVKLYPEVVEQSVAPNSTKLTIKLKNRGGGIGAVQVFVGNEFGTKLAVEDARYTRLKQNPNVPEATLYVDLQGTGYLTGKPNRVTVVTSNYLKEIGKGNTQSRGTEIVWLAGGQEEEYKLPTLYAIVGGVSDYAGDNLKLRFAAKDAEDFSNALSLGAKKLFCDKTKPNCIDKVNITTLSTSGNAGTILPTKENFVKAFREVAAKAKPEDIVVIYLAGHGVSFGVGTDSYFYLTQEARTTSREDLAKVLTTSAISSDELRDWLTPDTTNPNDIFVKAMKQVVILDTCASGNASGQLALTAKRDLSGDQIRAVEFLKDKTGTFVLMASTADAPSYEASQFGQGLLTYSLLQAMKGAALDKGEYVDVQQLFSYAQKEVPQLASNIGGVQRPIVSAPLGKTFVIGQMTDTEKKNLNLPAPKPLLLRPLLTNPETGDDDLKLIPQLRKLLDAESSYEVMRRSGKGDPTLIYIDDDTFPGAVRVTGTYTVEGKNVRVKAFLRQDGKTIATLPEFFTTKENVLNELLNAVYNELSKISIS